MDARSLGLPHITRATRSLYSLFLLHRTEHRTNHSQLHLKRTPSSFGVCRDSLLTRCTPSNLLFALFSQKWRRTSRLVTGKCMAAELFNAKVIHVHSSDTVDVIYDIDSTVRVYLTPKEHGLKLLADEEKKEGGEEDGEEEEEGVGCTTSAVKKGRLCATHTVKLSCADPDCDNPQVRGKFVCIKHGAYGYCTTDACINNAITTRGKCKKHDSKTVVCSVEGCSVNAVGRGVCSKHDALGACSFNTCNCAVKARGRCKKNGGGSKIVCKEEGCSTRAVARGVCVKHGAHGTCQVWRMHHQRKLWSFALHQTRQWNEEAVLRGGLHHQLPTQESLPQTWRRSRQVRVWWPHQHDGE